MMRAALAIASLSLVLTACGSEEPAPYKPNPYGSTQGTCTATEPSEATCNDGLDNDCDGFIDAGDTDCAGGGGGGGGGGDECAAGLECTDIQGGAVCLQNGGIPTNAPMCDVNSGEGCPTDMIPVSAQDQNGNDLCVCLTECTSGGGGGGGGGTDTCSAGTCTAITGADVCLDNGGVPAGAESCDGGVSCPTGDIPVNAQDQSGNTMCVCLEECDLGGGTTPTGDCPVGTCTAITGGNVCLEGGGIPASSPNCGADNSCPTDMVPVNAQDQSGNTQCVCLYDC